MSEELKTEVKNEHADAEGLLKSGKDMKDIDFDKVVRGTAPKDIEQKCLNLCKDYLSGNWSQQTIDTIEVRRITGGMSNQLYYCGVRQPNKIGETPQEVAIKFYGDFRPSNDGEKTRLKDQVISLIFSERGIGPKIYGIFEEGQIQHFYKQRPFSGQDRKDPQLIDKVFRTLARIHSMDFPIKKSVKQIEVLEKAYKEGNQTFMLEVQKYNFQTLLKFDLKVEIDWIKGVMERMNSPIVFCHSDYRSSNLMFTEPNDELVVCDYDLSAYNYRGADFSLMMREWKLKHIMLSLKSIEGIPLGTELKPFIEIYVDECQRIYGQSFTENPNNSVEHIIKEAKILLLFSYLFFTGLHLKPKENGPPPEKIFEMLETNYQNYFKIKAILEEQKIFD